MVSAYEFIQDRFSATFLHHAAPHLLSDHLGHHVSCMDVNGADRHDLLSIARCKLPNQHGDEGIKLGHLFPVVLFHGVVIALLKTGKRHADVRSPPDLCAGQCHLRGKQRINTTFRQDPPPYTACTYTAN